MYRQVELNPHISKIFNAQLEQVRTAILFMGGMVEKQLQESLQALEKQDYALAKQVKLQDSLINNKQLEIEHICTEVLAMRQPAARDLRLIMAVSKMTTDLERIADLARAVAYLVTPSIINEIAKLDLKKLIIIQQQVQKMLQQALNAFARLDLKLAMQVIATDKEINNNYTQIIDEALAIMQVNPQKCKTLYYIMYAARSIERIGDHIVNLCEYIIYLINGEDIRYQNLADIKN